MFYVSVGIYVHISCMFGRYIMGSEYFIYAHTLRHTRRRCDGDQCKPDSVSSPPHRTLYLYDNQLVTLPDSVFGGLSALA